MNLSVLAIIFKYWRELIIIMLSFLIFCLLMLLNYKNSNIQKMEQSYQLYKQQQIEANLKAQVVLQQRESEYKDQMIRTQKKYNEKIQQISKDARITEFYANSLSKQFTDANQRLSAATREVSEQYSLKLSDVFKRCITEYRTMAERADEYKANADKLK